jgi:O-antigen ligase
MTHQLWVIPFCVFLFVLPYPGTVALRLVCLAAIFVIAVVGWRRIAPPSLPMKSILVLWAMLASASLAYSVDLTYSIGEIKNELGYAMMTFVAFFVFCDDERKLKWLLFALAGGALILSSGALVTRILIGAWDDARWFGGVAAYASYLATVVPALVLLGYVCRNIRMRYAVGVLIAVMAVTGFLCTQRIVWPVLFLQMFVAILFCRSALKLSPARLISIIAVVTVALVAALMVVQGNRFKENVPSTQMSNDDRMMVWPKIAMRILEHPLTGAGFGRGVMKKAYVDLIPESNRELWHAHNVVLNYGLSMGIPGVLVVLLIFGALIRQYLRFWKTSDPRLKWIGACGVALVAGVFARNMVNDFFLRDGALLFWALNGSFLGAGLRLMGIDKSRTEQVPSA